MSLRERMQRRLPALTKGEAKCYRHLLAENARDAESAIELPRRLLASGMACARKKAICCHYKYFPRLRHNRMLFWVPK